MDLKLAGGSPVKKPVFPSRLTNPWQTSADDFPDDGAPDEQLWFAVNYAVLAPSPHNTQPWRFAIHDRNLDLVADRARRLPVADPDGRELILSCGAALFHLRLALRYFGYATKVELLPDPDLPDWLARVHLDARSEIEADAVLLFQAMPRRRTNRQPFRSEPVPAELLSELERAAEEEGAWLRVLENDIDRTAAADLVADADRRQWADKRFRNELAGWVRPAGSASRDGLPVATQELGSLMSHAGPFCIRTFDLGKGHAAKDHEIALHSPVLAILGTLRDEPATWLAAGQALARILLRAQGENVSASFLNQPVEVAELRPALAQVAGREGFPQVLLRMGYGDPVRHTPRRAVGEVLINN